MYFIYFFYFSFFSFARISFHLLCIHLYFLIVSLSFKRSSVNKLAFSFLTKMNFVAFTNTLYASWCPFYIWCLLIIYFFYKKIKSIALKILVIYCTYSIICKKRTGLLLEAGRQGYKDQEKLSSVITVSNLKKESFFCAPQFIRRW